MSYGFKNNYSERLCYHRILSEKFPQPFAIIAFRPKNLLDPLLPSHLARKISPALCYHRIVLKKYPQPIAIIALCSKKRFGGNAMIARTKMAVFIAFPEIITVKKSALKAS
ncbi:MAG: hypothetical protein LBD28_02315 [Tannerellaceae bacterium]|jgi:hypothetical protein|nr:hypothetical protein [Tannerellaceae bacterium]